jgi:hypothetical protein
VVGHGWGSGPGHIVLETAACSVLIDTRSVVVCVCLRCVCVSVRVCAVWARTSLDMHKDLLVDGQ